MLRFATRALLGPLAGWATETAREAGHRMVRDALLLAASVLFALAAAGFLTAVLYLSLRQWLDPLWVNFIIAIVLGLAAGLLLVLVKRKNGPKKRSLPSTSPADASRGLAQNLAELRHEGEVAIAAILDRPAEAVRDRPALALAAVLITSYLAGRRLR